MGKEEAVRILYVFTPKITTATANLQPYACNSFSCPGARPEARK